ncbi:DUF192 domain-containing protein [Roseateles sp. BYS180W]|uniref:DUF192 domain-containing protein n=1 Tax=Roseateles rivi TaxID=3299028 RepID=A0ABW7FYS6_9BURK
MTYIKKLLAIGLLAALAPLSQAQDQAQHLPSVAMSAGMHMIQAEVARTPQQRAIGLMHRTELAPNAGMIFVFEESAVQCFWMRNTLIPLSAAFLDEQGRVINIAEMKPRSDQSHCSTGPARYVLEMNTGWFSKRGIKAGHKLSGPFWPH